MEEYVGTQYGVFCFVHARLTSLVTSNDGKLKVALIIRNLGRFHADPIDHYVIHISNAGRSESSVTSDRKTYLECSGQYLKKLNREFSCNCW